MPIADINSDLLTRSFATSEEAVQKRVIRAVEDFDVRAATGARAGDDIAEAVVIHVADGHIHAAGECW